MKRSVIIGLGSISVVHTAALVNNDFAKIAAICDVDPQKIEATKKAIPYPVEAFTDYKEMLTAVKPDVVHICTPHYLHARMAIDALRSGADVYLEKPAALDYTEGLSILEAEKQSGKHVCVSFQNRVLPTHLAAKQLADSGELGAFKGSRGFVTWKRTGAYYTESPWRGKWATEGGGVLMNQSIHTLDLLYHLGGKVVRTEGSASLRKNKDIIDVEDTAEATLYYQNGAVGVFYATTCNAVDSGVQIELFFEKGALLLSNNCLYQNRGKGYELLVDGTGDEILGKMVWGNGHALMMKRFYGALDGGSEQYCTLEDGLAVLKIIGEIYKNCPFKPKR